MVLNVSVNPATRGLAGEMMINHGILDNMLTHLLRRVSRFSRRPLLRYTPRACSVMIVISVDFTWFYSWTQCGGGGWILLQPPLTTYPIVCVCKKRLVWCKSEALPWKLWTMMIRADLLWKPWDLWPLLEPGHRYHREGSSQESTGKHGV